MAKETRRNFLRKGLGLAAALITPFGLEGCYSQKEEDFYAILNQNPHLNEQEKGLARRVYGYIGSKAYEESLKSEEFKIDPEFFNSGLYAKWGLGKKQELNLKERAYLSEMEKIVPAFEEYNSIDVKRLDKKDQEFLEEFHKEYGANPTIESIVQKEKDSKDFATIIRILSGHEKLTDQDILIMKKIVDAYYLGIHISTSR